MPEFWRTLSHPEFLPQKRDLHITDPRTKTRKVETDIEKVASEKNVPGRHTHSLLRTKELILIEEQILHIIYNKQKTDSQVNMGMSHFVW